MWGSRRRFRAVVFSVLAVVCLGATAAPTNADPSRPPDRAQPAVPGIVIKMEPDIAIEPLAAERGLVVAETVLESRGIYLLRSGEGRNSHSKLNKEANQLKKLDGVAYAEARNAKHEFGDESRFHAWPEGHWSDAGNDPASWTDQANLAYVPLDDIHQMATGRGVTVALLDTGVDLDHPHLSGHLGSSGYDYVDDDAVPEDVGDGVDNDDDGAIDEALGHGTHTAGLIALIAPEAQINVYRVLNADGRGDAYLIAEAIHDAVANGADVINMSFGVGGRHHSKVLREALKHAASNNVVVIAAAGNRGSSAQYYPSGEKEVLGVAATADGNRELAGFSNFGKGALVAAPGEHIVSTVPGGGFGSWSGTSMSTSIVSAEVALMISVDGDRKSKDIVKMVGSATSKLRGRNKVKNGLVDIQDGVEKAYDHGHKD